jgi:hypothetical protein
VVNRWLPRVIGVLVALVLLPIAAQVGAGLYVAWFMRQAERQVTEQQLTVDGRETPALGGAEIRSNIRDLLRVRAPKAP